MIDKYIGAILFALATTSILAFQPAMLPGIILGTFIISIIVHKLWTRIIESSIGGFVICVVAGLLAVIGIGFISSETTNLLLIFSGLGWVCVSIWIMRDNIANLIRA